MGRWPYRTVLQAAAASEGNSHRNILAIFQTLAEGGAGINQLGGKFGSTPQAASFYRPTDAVGNLVEKGADSRTYGGLWPYSTSSSSSERLSIIVAQS
jgi:hypothetical protein